VSLNQRVSEKAAICFKRSRHLVRGFVPAPSERARLDCTQNPSLVSSHVPVSISRPVDERRRIHKPSQWADGIADGVAAKSLEDDAQHGQEYRQSIEYLEPTGAKIAASALLQFNAL
jgi:hypothetical protein